MSKISKHDTAILRRLAKRNAEMAADPVNLERKEAWYRLDAGGPSRPMVLIEFEGVRDAILPLPKESLKCQDEWARGYERYLRSEIYRFDTLKDDHVVEPFIPVNWKTQASNYGVEVVVHRGGDDTHMGSCVWDAPIRDLDRDFAKLRPRTFSVDREASLSEKAALEEMFDGLLPVRYRGGFYWTTGLTGVAINLIGLEALMTSMYDNPAGLHRLMAFLRDDCLAQIAWLAAEGLYSLNNANDYIGSGSMGYSRDLPRADWREGMPVRPCDLWVLSESQETVGVGPNQFEEFIFPYQKSIVERFGKCYYGCCEPVHNRWHVLKKFSNLARVSVSPWADQEFMARELGRQYVFSRKPNPTLISTPHFDEDAIRADLRATRKAATDCRLEVIMKDVHTLNNEPARAARWVQIAREELG
ncbi:MAG: hypothetical protein PHR35_01430 [Kiritimatiellae bacterium]|nr:hypothetical protein [Kiritimatiellia bacterium]